VSTRPVRAVVDGFDWPAISAGLDEVGVGLTPMVLEPEQCRTLAGLYDEGPRFRATIDMGRHRFGEGQYRYFSYPLPDLVAELRTAFWPHLLPIAREWAARRGQPPPGPEELGDWLAQCHASGQTRPTPLMLRYTAGDWNALHRDLYGDLVFPLQVVIGLDRPGLDFTGGELLVVEQRPRSQSRGTALVIEQGHAVIVTTSERPLPSARGWSRASVRHGVSVVRSGRRHTLGLLFHDAA
jgi:hypothetical protein